MVGTTTTRPRSNINPPTADSVEFTIPVSVSPSVIEFALPRWETDYDLVDFLATATIRQTPDTPSIIGDSTVVPATYKIAASFCSPKNLTRKSKTVILATHGIGQARSHWIFVLFIS